MKTVKGILEEYTDRLKEIQVKEARLKHLIEKSELIKLRHERDLIKLRHNWPNWIDEIVRPISEILIIHFPDRTAEILGPFGLSSSVSIHLTRDNTYHTNPNRTKEQYNNHWKGDNVLSITFRNHDFNEGTELVYETDEIKGTFKPGTVGALNGFNVVTKKVYSIEQIVLDLKEKQKKLIERENSKSQTVKS